MRPPPTSELTESVPAHSVERLVGCFDDDWRTIADPTKRKMARQRQWMRNKRATIPKQQDAHVLTFKASMRMRAYWQRGTLVPNGHKHTNASRQKLSTSMRYPKNVEKSKARLLRLVATLPTMKKGPDHHAGKQIHVRSPRGEIYHHKNVQDFVRQNANLFAPEDAVPMTKSGKSRASNGLCKLNPRNRSAYPTWKGWTWVSITERRMDDGSDPLHRQAPNISSKP